MKRFVFLGLMLICLSGLLGCRNESERVHVRIQNNSPEDIAYFWLGAGSGSGGKRSRSYGAIASGETTPYKSLEPTYGAYGMFNFTTADNKRYTLSIFPKEDIGYAELEPGYYTYAITITGDEAAVQLIPDSGADR